MGIYQAVTVFENISFCAKIGFYLNAKVLRAYYSAGFVAQCLTVFNMSNDKIEIKEPYSPIKLKIAYNSVPLV